MKLVIGLAVLLTLANNKVHGGFINTYDGAGEGQKSELQNSYSGEQRQEEPSLDYGGQQQLLGYGGQEQSADYGGQQQQGYEAGEIANHEQQINNEALERLQSGSEGENLVQWQGGFQASSFGEGQQDHTALTSLSGELGGYGGEISQGNDIADGHVSNSNDYGNLANLAAHGINLSGHQEFEGQNEHFDLKPKVEVQHHNIPTKTITRTKPYHVSVLKKIGVPVPKAVGVPTPQIIKVPIPQPYAVHVPVPHPISVPIYKLVPKEIEKRVPIEVKKLVPVYVDKPYKIEIEKHHVEYIDKPYPVHVPVFKHIYHHVPKHGSGGHSGGDKKW